MYLIKNNPVHFHWLLWLFSDHYTFNSLNLFILAQLCSKFSQVNLFKSVSSPLPGTHQYWCHMRNHGRGLCGI